MDISITLSTHLMQDLKQYYVFLEKLDTLGYTINIQDDVIFIEKEFDGIEISLENLMESIFEEIDLNFISIHITNLRIGIFYSNEEYAFLSIEFSRKFIKKLNKLKLNLEINSYTV